MADTKKPVQIRNYTLTELEQIAKTHSANISKYIDKLRVDIELFMESEFNLRIESFHRLKQRYSIYAFTVIGANYIFVDDGLLDDPMQEKKLRFTIGEEFAHTLLHRDVYSDCKTPEERIAKDGLFEEESRNRVETNARALSGMFLMPRYLVEPRVDEVIKTSGAETIEEVANHIKDDFDVNFRVARFRLKHLGYHRKGLREEGY